MKLDFCAFIKRWIFWGLTRPGQLSAPLPSRHGFMFLTSSEIQLGMYVVTKLPFQKVQSWFHAQYFQEAQDFDTVLGVTVVSNLDVFLKKSPNGL